MVQKPLTLGAWLRSLRKERGWSLEQLSAKSKVAMATLSRIENGKGTGTFRTHRRIADAFGITLPEMYRGLQEQDQEVIFIEPGSEEAETFTYDEKSSAILLTRQVTAKQMLPQLIMLQPGGKTSLEQYALGTERWVFGLEGAVEVQVGEKSYPVTSGGTLYFKASLPHRLHNNTDKAAKVISVTSPAAL